MISKTKSEKLIWLLFIVFLVLPVADLYGQRLKPGPQDLSFFSKVDETDQPYAIYIPKNFDESKKYPLVVFLHGAMSNHRLGLRRVFGQGNIQGTDFIKPGNIPVQNDLEVTRFFPELKDVDYIVAAPYARGTAGYQGIPEQDVYDMLADLKNRFTIDEDRVYLTGLSMGGGGTIWLGLTRPDIWAAIAPCCPAPPDGTILLAGNAMNLPVHLFIGDKDFLYQTAQDWRKKFTENAALLDYVEYPGIGHNSWEYAYKDGFIFDWFSQFKRDRYPERVKFSSPLYKYNKAYWVTFDKLTSGTLASIDAKFVAQNTLDITTNSLDAFTLNFAGHPSFKAASKVDIKIDGKAFSIKTPDALSFMKENGTWVNRRYTPGLNSKKQGAEGPMSAAIANNHIYVYGTGGNPTPEELQKRHDQAALAANWSADRGMMGRIMVFPRVISDKEIRQSDYETSNLILFGTRETNSIIEKFADKLPVQLNSDANDYCLAYVFPMNNHYILINSGLSWWTPVKPKEGEQNRAMRMLFMNPAIDGLAGFKDFVLFRETPDNIISQGSFDTNWAIPAAESEKMKLTGAVKMK
jgi:pimeloyl-ACP methyl ester carboxylesterase